MSEIDPCLFCDADNPERNTVYAENELAYARWDNFPVAPGHTEIVPKRHIESFFELSEDEVLAIHGLAKVAQRIILEKHKADAFNIGINDGEAAGRTIHHMHMHIIPRYEGDVENPRGGVRGIIPGMADY